MENITQGQWFRGPSADLGAPIDQSLRFRALHQSLSKTPSSSSSRTTWTWSGWLKKGKNASGTDLDIFGAAPSGHASDPAISYLYFRSNDEIAFFNYWSSTSQADLRTTAQFRDNNAWMHIVLAVDTTISSPSSDRIKLYVNGVQITDFATAQYPAQNLQLYINDNVEHKIGEEPVRDRYDYDGYMAEVHFVDGTQLAASDFGRFNNDGVWVPKNYTGTYGTNGYHLTFDSSQTNGIGHDSSGNDNHWTANGFDTAAISSSNFDNDIDYEDTPTNNTATLNPLVRTYNTLSEANLKWDQSSVNDQYFSVASMRMDQPTYGEMVALENTNSAYPSWGVCNEFKATNVYQGYDIGGAGIATDPNSAHCLRNGAKYIKASYINQANNPGAPTWSAGDIVRWTFNPNNGECRVAVNGGSFFTWHTFSASEVEDEGYKYFCAAASNTSGAVNFGNRPFVYSIPTGFSALQTNNLSEPTIKNGKEHFDVVTYAGTGSAQSITGLEFQPDLVWIKKRDNEIESNRLTDVVRGTGVTLVSDFTGPDNANSNRLTAFNSDGFSLGTETGVNRSGRNYVAWCWKAGGTAVSNTDGTITSSVSANTDAGFSIVSWTGNATQNASVGHGLTEAPEMIFIKNRADSVAWTTYTTAADGSLDYANLNGNAAWGNTSGQNSPTNTVFSLWSDEGSNGNNDAMIAYCWHSVSGFSQIGSYTGNGSADGPFIYTGFKPAFVLIRNVFATGDWTIHDAGRFPNNPSTQILRANTNGQESGTGNDIDIVSNGFKIRNSISLVNTSGNTYVYMAFASNPFGGENAPPATAR